MSRPSAFRRRLLLNTAAHGFTTVWMMVLTLVTLPALLHGLGPETFGIWVLIQTFSADSGWLSLADLGIAGALTRSVAGHASTDRHREHLLVLSSGVVLLVGIGACASILLAVLGPSVLTGLFQVPPDQTHAAGVAIVVFSGQVFLEFVLAGFRAGLEGAQRVDLSRAVVVVTRTLQLGSTAVLALSGRGLVAVAVGSVVSTAIGALAGAVLLGSHLPGRLGRPSVTEMRALVAYGVRIAGLNASGVLHRTMDRLVVGAIIGPSGVALVEIAAQVQGGASAVLASTTYVALSASPWVAAREAPGKLRELLIRGTKYSMLATLPVVLGVALVAVPLVDVWVGPSYAAAAGLIQLALVYIGLAATVTVATLMLEGTGHAGRVLGPSLVTTVLNLVLSIVLVRRIGVAGAFIATILAMAVFIPAVLRHALRTYALGLATFLRSSIVPSWWPSVGQAALTGLVVAAPLGSLGTLLLGGGLGLGAFVAIAWRWSLGRAERGELLPLLRPAPASDT